MSADAADTVSMSAAAMVSNVTNFCMIPYPSTGGAR